MAIIYKCDILTALQEAGWTTYTIRKNKIFGEGTMTRIRSGEIVSIDSLNTLCKLLKKQPGELIEYVDDQS